MYKLKFIITIIFSVLFISSCNFQKRVYNKGYHIDWFVKDYQYPKSKHSIVNHLKEQTFDSTKHTVKHSNSIHLIGLTEQLPILEENKNDSFNNCDIIFLKNGEEVDAIVTEIDIDIIKYKRCLNPNGPVYTMFKSEIMMIKYKNGTKDIFVPSNTTTPTRPDDIINRETIVQSGTSSNLQNQTRSETNPLAILGFLLSLISLIIPFPAFLLTSLTSIIFGLSSINSDYIALSILAIVIGIIVLIIGLAVLAA